MTAEEIAINALTAQTSGLLEVCVALKSEVATQITAAVVASENAAVIPLITMATNLLDTQAMLIMYIGRGL